MGSFADGNLMFKRNRLRQIAYSIATVLFAVAVGGVAYHMVRVRLCDRVLTKIDRLASYPPSDMGELEWAVHVYWTHNLHCNAMPLVYASYGAIRDVEQILDDTLTNGPNRLTIDAIWDRYAMMTPSGAAYQQKYELEKDAIATAVAAQGSDYPFVNDYRDFVQYERSRR